MLPVGVSACESGSFPLFGCEAAKSRKFIELCAPSPLDGQSGYLVYRFGSLDADGNEKSVELEYPAEHVGSLKHFYAATYTHNGVYTQSVRFASGNFGYTVFTRAKGMQTIAAGVEVHDTQEWQDVDCFLQRTAALLHLRAPGIRGLRCGNARRQGLHPLKPCNPRVRRRLPFHRLSG